MGRNRRHQDGYLYKTKTGWNVRYWVTELRSGQPIRVQKSKKHQSGSERTPAPVPLIGELCLMFAAWRSKCGNPKQGWVFENRVGDPINLEVVARNIIVPTLTAKKLILKGLYSGRRSAGTLLTQLTGNALAAFYVLRHKDLATTTGFCVKATPEPAVEGMRLLGERMAQRRALAAANDSEGA